ncbi:MAG: SDR family oxidoreductase [Comamonadaceae bacterium]|nr:MAG: SDR family oxidoreductase [Comamonadaceae bacterium]
MMPAGLQQFSLEGRLALITGSSDGIGLALARGLASAGARVVLNGRDAARLDAAVARLRGEGHDAVAARFDVTAAADVADGIAAIESGVGAIDILFNNAGMQRRAPLQDFAAADWSALMRTNLDSVFHVSQAVARHMIARGRGKIVNTCSVQSELARPGVAPYAASKGAVKMLTKGMAVDWGPHGIQVNGIGPGYFKTSLTQPLVDDPAFSSWLTARTPSRRWGDVDDLVGAAIYLASDASRFVNGHILYVDGGVTAAL